MGEMMNRNTETQTWQPTHNRADAKDQNTPVTK